MKIKEARKIAQEARIERGDESWYSRHFVRWFSIYISVAFASLGIRANLVTVLMGMAGLCGSFFMIPRNPYYNVLGAILWQLWSTLDCVDGEVARLQGSSSLVGVFIDDLTHIIVNPTFGLALGLHVTLNDWSILNGLATLLLYSACHWRAGIQRITKTTLLVKTGIDVTHSVSFRFDKKSIVSWFRFMTVQSFQEIGQMFIFPAVIILNYWVKKNIVTWFLYLYTGLFLGYLAARAIRDGYIVHQEDMRTEESDRREKRL